MLENLFLSLFGAGNVTFISFGLGLSDDGSDLFYLYILFDFYVSVESVPVLFSEVFLLFPDIFISSLLSFVKSTTKILLGITLLSLLSFVYTRIGIGTIEVTENTQQVLAVLTQTAKPLRQHRPIQVTSFPTD